MGVERNDFIRDIIDEDLAAKRHTRVATRFTPEPNGYLHIGHAKSICLNFGIARDYQGTCNLRYDDTNPTKEDVEYVDSIERDVRWLGFAPAAVLFSADYFPKMYELAEPPEPVPRPHARRQPRAAAPHEGGRAARRRVHAAREDRHGVAQHEDARPAALPDPPRAPPPQRRRLVHLSDVRLRASARGRDRGHHPLDLHARVREQPRALRLGDRRDRRVAGARLRATPAP